MLRAWFQASTAMLVRSALFGGITQRTVVIPYRRFGTSYRSDLQGSISSWFCVISLKSADLNIWCGTWEDLNILAMKYTVYATIGSNNRKMLNENWKLVHETHQNVQDLWKNTNIRTYVFVYGYLTTHSLAKIKRRQETWVKNGLKCGWKQVRLDVRYYPSTNHKGLKNITKTCF
jgi:hypothetical protein